MDTLLPAISSIADQAVVGSARSAKPASRASGTTSAKSATTTETAASAKPAATTGSTKTTAWAAPAGTSETTSRTLLSIGPAPRILVRVVSKLAWSSPETWALIGSWIPAHLLQSPAQSSIQQKGVVRAVALNAWYLRCRSRAGKIILAFQLIGEFNALVAPLAGLLAARSACTPARESRPLAPGRWARRPRPRAFRRSRPGDGRRSCLSFQRQVPFLVGCPLHGDFFADEIEPEHLHLKRPGSVL